MTADNGNGNGELRELLEIKRAYRKNLTSLEEELTAKFKRELIDGKKRLKEQYLENVVDTVFADPAPTDSKPLVVEPSVPAEPTPPSCPECGSSVGANDKFCANCAYPLKEDVKDDAPMVTTGRKLRTGRRS